MSAFILAGALVAALLSVRLGQWGPHGPNPAGLIFLLIAIGAAGLGGVCILAATLSRLVQHRRARAEHPR